TLYKSLVRPILEYGQPVWAPFLKRQTKLIENVQRRATKLISDIKHLPYEDRLADLQLPSLKYRRLRGDLIQTFNIISKGNDQEISKFFNLNQSSCTRGHNFKLNKVHTKTNMRMHSFTNRVINAWNNLPQDTVNAPDVDTFKKLLDGDLLNLLYIYD
ncbi:MAG: hypothetical protein GY694_16045, partial [Gammaproteobacteria bacterium]|nr:hypothetical protein [Gammaproteobacteria bacterium]